ncbi:hypothetical protein RND81_14G024600 [Saponaria officinalis]|uniref:Uncharacterized protein n=1 Tax=Saponaria officinalis TaxID=3572 RepID=A0AAW1GKZ5_SAPOF
MGILDVKIELSTYPFWKIRNERLRRLKSIVVRSISDSSNQISTSTSSNQKAPEAYNGLHMPEILYSAAAADDVDGFLGVLEQVSIEKKLECSDILQLLTPSGNTLLHVAVINRCVGNVKLLTLSFSGTYSEAKH